MPLFNAGIQNLLWLSEVNLKCTVGNMDILIIFNMRTNKSSSPQSMILAVRKKYYNLRIGQIMAHI